jgi:AcrR family transcriptional regulator
MGNAAVATAVKAPSVPSSRAGQKDLTRQRIRQAASALFYAEGYTVATIEQIACASGISRRTFYLHFKDKDEVLRDIGLDYIPRATAVMRRLPGPRPSLDEVNVWLHEWAQLVAAEKVSLSIFRELAHSDPTSRHPPFLQEMIDQLILALSERIAAFRTAVAPGARRLEALVRAELLIVQAFGVCGSTARTPDVAYDEMALAVIAARFKAFIDDKRLAAS